jgi:hypothetical protein
LINGIASKFIILTNLLGIPYNDAKDEYGQRILILGYLLDINTFKMSILDEKITKICNAINNAL